MSGTSLPRLPATTVSSPFGHRLRTEGAQAAFVMEEGRVHGAEPAYPPS